MGWFGSVSTILNYLRVVNADRDEEGNFLIAGENISTGFGGQDAVVSEKTVYFVDGQEKNLAHGLNGMSQGLAAKVF